MMLIGVCAIGMYTMRAAAVYDLLWAKIASLLIATVIGCFVVYAILFCLANLFTASTAPLAKSAGRQEVPKDRPSSGAQSGDL